MTQALPLCVIGAGSIGMRHVEVAQASPLIALTAIVEADAARRAELSAQGLPVVARLEDIPKSTKAAVIATPTGEHHQNALEMIGQGLAVIVEKPLTATLAEGRAVMDAAQRAGVPLVTGHHRRCHPFAIKAREMLAALGDLVGVQGVWSLRKHDRYFQPLWRRSAGAGPLMTNLSHEMDLLRFLIGDVAEVTALTSSARRGLEIEDTAALALRFDNGALGSFLISDAGASPWSFEAGSFENPAIAGTGQDYLRIIGTQGALEFPSLRLWLADYAGEVEWSKGLSPNASDPFPRIDPILAQMERFAHVVAGAEDDVLCSGADGLAAMEATLATALSAKCAQPVARGGVPPDFRGI